jgi:pilus assembly protein CpaE
MPAGKETIRILIVDDMADMRENLRKLLSFETDFEVIGAAANGVEGIKLAKQFQPNIVLMDINMPGGVDGIAASESISQEVPSAAIIMMSVQSESDYLRRSMLAGARDFLTKPFTSDGWSGDPAGLDMNRSRLSRRAAGGGPAGGRAGPRRSRRRRRAWGGSWRLGAGGPARRCGHQRGRLPGDTGARQSRRQLAGDIGVLLNLSSAHSIADAVPGIAEPRASS